MTVNKPSLWRTLTLTLLAALLSITQPAGAQSAVEVVVSEAQTSTLYQEVPITGSITAVRRSMISVEVAGAVSSILVDVGDSVAEGDTLIHLDSELGQIAFDSAQAAKKQAELALTESQRLLSEARTLAKQKNIADSEVETRASQVEINQAALEAADALMRQRHAELIRHQVGAPFSGVISRRLVDLGQWVTPGTAVFELVATDNLRLDFQVPQRFFPLIDENSELSVTFETHPERQHPAQIKRAIPATYNNTRSFLLTAQLTQQAPSLIAGMSVAGTLKLSDGRTGVTVHRDAIIRYPDGRITVWTIDTGETPTAREVMVKVGLSFADRVELVSGISAGQKVIVEGNESIREGQKVQVRQREQDAQ